MKTIFIPVQSRQIARNILRTSVLDTLLKKPDCQVVIVVPHFKHEEYQKEFIGINAVFESVNAISRSVSKLDRIFGRISLFYIDSPTARFLRRQWLLYERRSQFRYFISRTALYILGNVVILKRILRYLDYILIRDERYSHIFSKYNPALVFLPRIDLPLDRSFLRHAKKRKIPTVGMINSWDNITLSKYPFRILPDVLIVHNEIIKEEAEQYLNMPAGYIRVSGLPHFDHYVTRSRISREEFCEKLNIDPKRRIILFASIGSTLNPTAWQVLKLLDDAIQEERLLDDVVIVFRFHPSENINMDRKIYSQAVIFDDSKTLIKGEKKYTEVLRKDMDHLADSLFHTEMTITTASTMTIDAAAFDRPSINIAFDGWEERPFHESVRRFYEPSHDHYQPIVKSGGVRIAYSFDELLKYINMYLEDPGIDHEGRMRIVKEQCYKLDGKSGERIAQFILFELREKSSNG